MFAVSDFSSSPSELVQKPAVASKTAKIAHPQIHLVKREMLASAAQGRLAQKDRRIFNSIALAAKHQEVDGEAENKEFLAARTKQMQLDARLQSLTQKLSEQELALSYMRPKVEERDHQDQELGSYATQLKDEIPLIQGDLAGIRKKASAAKEAIKPLKDELKRTEEVLAKSRNAYALFGEREDESRGKAAQARRQVEELNFASLRAEQGASQLRKEAVAEHDGVKAKYLAQEAKAEDAKVAMLNKQSAEMMQSAQLFDAEADEATAYQTMFAADLESATSEGRQQAAELQGAERTYAMGQYLEQSGLAREKLLQKDLTGADAALAQSGALAKQDDAALARGEKSTEQTETELRAAHGQAMTNTLAAEKIVAAEEAHRAAWSRDAAQAYSLRVAAAEHRRAAQHLKLAAAAAAEARKV
jgi:archaellum component FlaC